MRSCRFALRLLVRSPGFSAVVIFTLALGIGASTLIFSVVNGVLLKPLPYPEPERIVRVFQVGEEGGYNRPSDPNFFDLKEQSRSFAAMAQFGGDTQPVVGGREPARVGVAFVSREFFDVMGVQPAFGRTFVADELHTGGAPAALISHAYWQRYLAGDPEFAAQTLRVGDRLHSIVGVMPPGFDFPDGADVWAPAELWPVTPSRTSHNWQAIGRLAPGVSLAQAREDLGVIARRLKAEHGDDTWMVDATAVPLHDFLVRDVRLALLSLLAAVALLFCVAAANAANLLLARAVAREQEFSVRAALGAGRWRFAGQFFGEALVLCGLGGAIGIGVARWGIAALVALDGGRLPRLEAVTLDWTVASFALGLTLAAAAGLSLLVAWRATASGVVLRYNQRPGVHAPRSVLRESLIVAQIALALTLLVGALLLGRSFVRLASIDPGFRTDGLVFLDLPVVWRRETAEFERLVSFYAELMTRLRALPGVDAVGGITAAPFSSGGWNGMLVAQNHPDEIKSFDDFGAAIADPARTANAEYRIASEDYFNVLDIPLLSGRFFERRDGPDAAHVALVSRSLAELRWPGDDPIGKLVQFGNMDGDLTPFTVIGVVADVRELRLDSEPRPTFYGYYRQRPRSMTLFSIALRSPDPELVIPAAREIVRGMNPELVPQFRTAEELYSASLAQRRLNLVMLGVFGGSALLLALAGIYGSIAFSVAQRTHEIGVRIALGAQRPRVVGMVVRRSLLLAGLGVAAGLAVALGASRLVASLLYGIPPHDPVSYAAAAAGLLLAALAAAWLPALRAARVDPVIALRSE